jgi:hypothetical protein
LSGSGHIRFDDTDVKRDTLASRSAPPLGVGAKLARVKRRSGTPIDEPRLEATLTIAYGRPIDKLRLAHARRAVEKMRQGEVACALMHLPLTGLGKLSQPKEAAWRLLAAEGLMGSGVDLCLILRALALDNPLDARP